MMEIGFPLIGTGFVLTIVLPAFALLAKLGLVLLERPAAGGPLHGFHLRYLLLTGSSFLPLTWLLSAGLHQAESGESVLACIFDHGDAARCWEPGVFAAILSLALLVAALPTLRGRRRPRSPGGAAISALTARIEGVLRAHPELHRLRGRFQVADAHDLAMGTEGWTRPRVIVGLAFATGLSDDMLASALGHENEHVRSRDPLRFLLLRLALAVNPFGRWLLEPHAQRWFAGREIHCDREAVLQGSSPLALAEAIVRAARPYRPEAVALGAKDMAALNFRVAMLLAFAERRPVRCCPRSPLGFPAASLLMLLALLLPHRTGTAALDVLHMGAEHALSLVLG